MIRIFTAMVAIAMILCTTATHAQQVGVNTNDPKATLDIVGQPTIATAPDGVKAPNITRAQLTAKDAAYTAAQTGTLVYVTTLDGTTTTKTTKVTAIGYYYFDGSVWQFMGSQNGVFRYFSDASNFALTSGPYANAMTLTIPQSGTYSIDALFAYDNSYNKPINYYIARNGVQINLLRNNYQVASNSGAMNVNTMSKAVSGFKAGDIVTLKARAADTWGSNNMWNREMYAIKISDDELYTSTNGSAEVSGYGGMGCTGSGTIEGLLTQNLAASGVTMKIYANVTQTGTYNITTNTVSGITFSGSGTFTTTGCQLVTLTASGTPTACNTSATFTTTTTPNVSATYCAIACEPITTAVVSIISPKDGSEWMDRNLGATQRATSVTDAASYGYWYQWGRATDGHQIRTSITTTTLATSATPNMACFILPQPSGGEWMTPSVSTLWQGVNGTNNPCPSGYRLPTNAEFDAALPANGTSNPTLAQLLYMPFGGGRHGYNGSSQQVGVNGSYWSSSTSGAGSSLINIGISSPANTMLYTPCVGCMRSNGVSVRCRKD